MNVIQTFFISPILFNILLPFPVLNLTTDIYNMATSYAGAGKNEKMNRKVTGSKFLKATSSGLR